MTAAAAAVIARLQSGGRDEGDQAYRNVLFDLILTGDNPQVWLNVLNARVWANRRFWLVDSENTNTV